MNKIEKREKSKKLKILEKQDSKFVIFEYGKIRLTDYPDDEIYLFENGEVKPREQEIFYYGRSQKCNVFLAAMEYLVKAYSKFCDEKRPENGLKTL